MSRLESWLRSARTQILSTRQIWLPLAAIVVLGALLRLPGQLYPVVLHYDEGSEVSSVLCRFPPTGAFYHPFLSRYLLSVPENVLCAASKLRGSDNPVIETRAAFELDPISFVQIGRGIALLFGLAAIVVTYMLGRSLGGVAVGLAAALFLAVSPVHIIVSNNLRPWALASLLTASVLLFLKDVIQPTSSRWRLAIVGALTGLAIATVYPLALLAFPVLVALVVRWRSRRALGEPSRWASDMAVTATGGLVAHLFGNLTGVMNIAKTLEGVLKPTASMLSDTAGALENPAALGYLQNVGWYFGALFDPLGLGAVVATVGLLGLMIVARRGEPVWLAMLVLVAVVLLVQPLAVVLMANRYTIPAVPVLVVAAAWLVVTVSRRLSERWVILARIRPALLFVLLMAVPGLLVTVAYHRALALTPTRELARAWIEAHLPQGTTLVQNVRYMSPVLADCRVVAKSGRQVHRPCYDVRFTPTDSPRVVLDYLQQSDAGHLVYTAATPIGMMERLGSVDAVPVLRQRYQLLARFHHPGLDMFHDDTATVNPPVEIYRLTPR